MSNVGYFYADAFSLVRPTTEAVKGINCVDAINRDVLLPEIFESLVKVNAGTSLEADAPQVTSGRFSVVPPMALLKEIFPWIKPLLMNAYGQNDNNEDVRFATRFLRLLKELRTVLVQDVAFMMLIPSLKDAIKEHSLFSHSLFTSEKFKEYCQEMRMAVDETEIKAVDEALCDAFRWASDYKSENPAGNAKRAEPTAPKLDPSVHQSRGSGSVGTNSRQVDDMDCELPQGSVTRLVPQSTLPAAGGDMSGNKRPLSSSQASASESIYTHEHNSDIVGVSSNKRHRRIYDEISNAAPRTAYPEKTANGGAQAPHDSMTSAIDQLRIENNDLRSKLNRLEYIFGQHKADTRAWMTKVERVMRSIMNAPGHSDSTPPNEPPHKYQQQPIGYPSHQVAGGQRYPPMSSPVANAPVPRGPTHHPSNVSSPYIIHPQRVYSETRYYHPQPQQEQMHTSGARQPSPSAPSSRDGYGKYDRAPINNDGAIMNSRRSSYAPNVSSTMRANGQQQPSHISDTSNVQSPRRNGGSQYMPVTDYNEYRRGRQQHQQPSNSQQKQQPASYSHEQMYTSGQPHGHY
ncbi:hypothetical protein GGI05_004610 [Coemansia sp. RSA 2603]|nr:hypothetical protein GGI05_004610 [Coemansia sp. RSA 2603]